MIFASYSYFYLYTVILRLVRVSSLARDPIVHEVNAKPFGNDYIALYYIYIRELE